MSETADAGVLEKIHDGGTGGRIFGTGFKGERGVTQGDPLSPTILNLVVNAVVRHWVTLEVVEAEMWGEQGREGRHQATLFYTYDGMVALSDPRWLQWAFTTLVGLFDRVGLQKTWVRRSV